MARTPIIRTCKHLKLEREGLNRNDAAPALPPSDAAVAIGLEPLRAARRRWPTILGALLTALMVVGLGYELLDDGLAGLTRTVPTNPLFFVFFAMLYLSLPTGDYIIFRRLWGLPIAGFSALIKKRIANEVLFSLSGEAYFYTWARANARAVAAPFGAVKDVSILSAIAGNSITLAMMALSIPLGYALLPDGMIEKIGWSAAIIVGTSVPFLIFSRKVFSLDRRTLWWVFRVHSLRLIAGSTLIALAWNAAMPDVPVAMWLFLAAGRLLVSRLPLVPNKDLVFANFAIVLIGQGEQLSDLVAFTAASFLLTHIVVIAGFGVHHIVTRRLPT